MTSLAKKVSIPKKVQKTFLITALLAKRTIYRLEMKFGDTSHKGFKLKM